MEFKAFKMDGLGNDFVIIDQREKKYDLNNSQIKKICDRGNIGCDQLILINKSDKFDAFLTFKNSDEKISLDDELSDVLFVLLCLANQTGVDLQKSFDKRLEQKAKRDHDRHHSNSKLG